MLVYNCLLLPVGGRTILGLVSRSIAIRRRSFRIFLTMWVSGKIVLGLFSGILSCIRPYFLLSSVSFLYVN